MSKLTKGYGSTGLQAILGDIKTYYEGELAKKANTSDIPVITGKADKVENATAGNLAALDASGNLTDSGVSASSKADKVSNATSGHLAGLDSNGNLTDSGVSPTEDVTVEGNPVTFDSPFEQDAKSVVVTAKPIQDLHGYDHPWVGGAGRNKIDDGYSGDFDFDLPAGTAYYKRFLTTSDSHINTRLQVLIDGSYVTVNDNDSMDDGGIITTGVMGWGENAEQIIVTTKPYTFRITSSINSMVPSLCHLMLTTDSMPTSYSPYSNICPISGIDEVEIGVSGKNLLPLTASFPQTIRGVTFSKDDNGVITAIRTSANENNADFVCSSLVLKAGTYTYFAGNYGSGSTFQTSIQIDGVNRWGVSAYTFTLTKDSEIYIICRYYSDYSGTAKYEPQIVLGTEATEYEPYNPNSHTTTIPLPSTLYDADVDVTEGNADSQYGMVVFDGSNDEEWLSNTPAWSASCFAIYNMLVGAKSVSGYDTVANILSNDGGAKTPAQLADRFNSNHGVAQGDGTRLFINLSNDIDTVEKLRIYLAEHPLQVAYELATPTTLSFTPTDVELLEGTNVVTTNGEKVAVTYKAGILATLGDIDDLNDKVKTKFDKKDVAKVESANASKAYAVGDYMLRSDGFYRVTANIASGAAITSNNTTKVTVGGELANKVNNDDSRLSNARMPSNDIFLLHTSGNEGWISGTKYFMNGNIAMAVDQFSESNTYEVGSYTVYQGQLYKCTVRHFESDWDSSHFAISNNIIVANGTIAAGTYETIGSDYAENFEALENCPVRRFVTLDGEKIRLAQPNDYILGVTSESPSVIGDSMKQGISVGLLGKLWVEHDGSAEINGYVISGENGIAIKSDKGYRVMAIDGNKCKVLVK